MPKIITVEYMNEIQFLQMPKAFLYNPKYEDMSNEAKLVYTLLRDLVTLSIENKWINDNHEVYVKFSRTKLANKVHVSPTNKKKIAAIMRELKDLELIVEKPVGLNRCNEIYVCIPEDLAVAYDPKDLLDDAELQQPDPNVSSGKILSYPQANTTQPIDTQGGSNSSPSGSSKNGTSGGYKNGTSRSSNSSPYIKTNFIQTKGIKTNSKQQPLKEKKEVVVVDPYGNQYTTDLDSIISEIKEIWRSHYVDPIPNTTLNLLISLLPQFDKDLVTLLIDLSTSADTSINNYIKSIVTKWRTNKVKTFDDYFDYDQAYQRGDVL